MFGTYELIVKGFLLFYQLSYGLVSSLDLLSENSLQLNVLVLENADSVLSTVEFIRSTHSTIVKGSSFILTGFV